ncbi:glycosyl hydrolase 53 family protein [Paenibacillus pini]|uniref:Arabinogalactan endo-beta-1,4-galactanase n=1 Tax=Paenibacillus pini JCM 16418 TaxID=1236976 RepID=W7YK67_9BACL|nr:glycosyl hydrolase 53 family protein [Paenibacillus pini]GAF08907.1 arabinogalactan endo-1,4-beta-galactosidase [Paenibacillus pini JCM 16418]
MLKKRMRKFVAVALCCILSTGWTLSGTNQVSAAASVAKGADIGWLSQLEANGYTWKDQNGVQKDALQILKDNGVDSVRLRVFVNPPSSFTYKGSDGVTSYLGFNDKAGVVAMARRADALGLRIMIDFHYSDVWADPGKQIKPASWEGHSFNQLLTDVYDHTYDVMNTLKSYNIYPEWVQVGNEINYGMVWPEGKDTNFGQLTQLINSGYDAVKTVSPSSKVVVHLAYGQQNAHFRTWFDKFQNNGGKWDVIGISGYMAPGTNYMPRTEEFAYNLNDMAARYNKEVMVSEFGGRYDDPENTYSALVSELDAIKSVPNGKGIGVFYWEPESAPGALPDGYPLGAAKVVGTKQLQFTKAISAYNSNSPFDTSKKFKIVNRNSGKALNITGGSTQDGAAVQQWTYSSWNSQKFYLLDSGNGNYRIQNVNSMKLLDIENSSLNDGAKNIQWSNNWGLNQLWKLTSLSGGYVQIQNGNSGKLLDINGASTADGASTIQWFNNGGSNQQWAVSQTN